MSLDALGSVSSQSSPLWAQALESPLGMPSTKGVPSQPTAADAKKAAGQFEAIILRQMLGPTIEPMMSGGLGGTSAGGGGGGIYGYLLTDVLCNSLGASGGLGLANVLQTQLMPAGLQETEAAEKS